MGRKTEEEEKTNANSAKSPITVTGGTGTSGRERLQWGAKEAVRRPTALPSILAAGQLPCGSPTQGTIETIFPGKENRGFLEQWHYTRRCAHTVLSVHPALRWAWGSGQRRNQASAWGVCPVWTTTRLDQGQKAPGKAPTGGKKYKS